ncbi:MAG: Rid family detoxifying hydrolase [Betaproteobacteria bacterium]|nr:Rid family detoxifying hydrolase [Betaproteobacteria bacterium]
MSKKAISAPTGAPAAIGPYSVAIASGDLVFVSGQIPLDPKTMQLVEGFDAQVRRVFDNLAAVCKAAGGSLADLIKITVYVTDLADFPKLNEIAAEYLDEPYPARATIAVAGLPKDALVEIEGIMRKPG